MEDGTCTALGVAPPTTVPASCCASKLATRFGSVTKPTKNDAFWNVIFSAHHDKDVVLITDASIPTTFPTKCFNISNGGAEESEGPLTWVRWREIANTSGGREIEYNDGDISEDNVDWSPMAGSAYEDQWDNLGGALPPSFPTAGVIKTSDVQAPNPIQGYDGDDACSDCNDGTTRNVTLILYH